MSLQESERFLRTECSGFQVFVRAKHLSCRSVYVSRDLPSEARHWEEFPQQAHFESESLQTKKNVEAGINGGDKNK